MKELPIFPINQTSKDFLKWFNDLYYGVKKMGNVKLFALNNKYCLIKVVFPGHQYFGSAHISGSTYYLVLDNHCDITNYGQPQNPLYEVQGKFLKSHIEYVEKTYKLMITK